MYQALMYPELKILLEENDAAGMGEFCDVLHPAVTAEILEKLDSPDAWKVLKTCKLERQVEILEYMTLAGQVDLINVIDRKRLTRLLEEMSPDDRVDLLSRMKPEKVENLLPSIAQVERNDIRKLLSFPEYSAGSIMTTEYASLPEGITAREALDRLRVQAPDRETIYYVYIIDEGRRLHGFISLRELILAKPTAKLADIMQKDVISVRVTDDQEIVAQELAKYDFLAIPVVDNQNQLVGIVTHDDVLDVIREEATEDAQRMGGMQPLDDSYLTTPIMTLTWKRGVWLVLLLGAAVGTAGVLSQYAEVSQRHPWLILFFPLVLASGGNAGSQSATLIIRTLALGELDRRQTLRIAIRELALASQLGSVMAVIAFCFALLFGDFHRALVVAGTVLLVVVMGAVTGAMLPLGFKRLGMDPGIDVQPLNRRHRGCHGRHHLLQRGLVIAGILKSDPMIRA